MVYHKLTVLAALMVVTLTVAAQVVDTSAIDKRFIKHIITRDFVSEGVAIADVNNDGKPDILAGAYWFEAPTWTKHEIDTPRH